VGEGGGVVYLSKVVRYMALLLFYVWWDLMEGLAKGRYIIS